MIKPEYWTEIAVKMGYKSEKEMWDAEYMNSPQGFLLLSDKMKTFDPWAPSYPTVGRRIAEQGYDIKPRGGPRVSSPNFDRLKALGLEACLRMTRPEIMKRVGYRHPSSFYAAMKRLGFKYKYLLRWRAPS